MTRLTLAVGFHQHAWNHAAFCFNDRYSEMLFRPSLNSGYALDNVASTIWEQPRQSDDTVHRQSQARRTPRGSGAVELRSHPGHEI